MPYGPLAAFIYRNLPATLLGDTHRPQMDAIQAETNAKDKAKCIGKTYTHIVLTNGTYQSNCLHAAETCFLSRQDKWTESQRQRANVLFEIYPDLKEAYSLTHSLSMIFSRNAIKVLLGCSLRTGMTK